MKFKVGDKVKFTYTSLVGRGTIRIVDNSFLPYQVVSENGSCWWLKENELELIKPDLRDLLQVGYKVEYKFCNPHKMTIEIGNEEYLALIKKNVNQDLIGSEEDIFTINAIYRPKYNGLKPMEWVLVWEREEELFTLELPNCKHSKRYLCVMVDDKNVYRFSKLNPNVNRQHNHLKCFTQQEIDNLPNQELIKALVKKEVKGHQAFEIRADNKVVCHHRVEI